MRWLFGGNDRQLASSSYADRESASEKAAAKARAKQLARRQKDIWKAADAAEAWEAADRRRWRR